MITATKNLITGNDKYERRTAVADLRDGKILAVENDICSPTKAAISKNAKWVKYAAGISWVCHTIGPAAPFTTMADILIGTGAHLVEKKTEKHKSIIESPTNSRSFVYAAITSVFLNAAYAYQVLAAEEPEIKTSPAQEVQSSQTPATLPNLVIPKNT